jgi:hypothetical protein
MQKQRFLRASLVAVLGVLAVLIAPAAAHATATITADCAGWYVDYTAWDDGPDTSHVTATLDGVVTHDLTELVTDDDQTLSGAWPTSINDGLPHEVVVVHDWVNHGGGTREFSDTVTCAAPPPPPVYDCEGKVLPPGTTPPTCPPPTTTTPPPPPTTTVTQQGTPPASGTLPETILSGRARLRGPSGCVKQAFRARVTGRSIAAVRFYVDGKLFKRVAGSRSQYSVKINPRNLGLGRHRVVARVRFDAATGTEARRLPLTFRRCARQTVQPRFTG